MRFASALRGALFGLVVLFAVPSAGWAADPAAARDEFAWRVVELTNAERARHGLPPLAMNPSLVSAAQDYAEVLASTGCFGHQCGPVPALEARTEQAGYGDWSALGENIAGGQQSPEQVVAGWMASSGHRSNILNPSFSEIGVGLATGGPYGIYWAQTFGATW